MHNMDFIMTFLCMYILTHFGHIHFLFPSLMHFPCLLIPFLFLTSPSIFLPFLMTL